MPAFDATDAVFSLNVRIEIRNIWRLRLGLWLASIAAKILKCQIKIERPECS